MAKTTVKTPAPISPIANEIFEVLKNAERPMTLADIRKVVEGANPAHLTALRTRGLVEGTEIEIEATKVVKSKVLEYRVKGE